MPEKILTRYRPVGVMGEAWRVILKGNLSGKVVLITGAGLGVGREMAVALAKRGAIVAANSLTPVNLDDTIAQVRALGGQAQAYVADIASKLALQSMLNEIIDQYGRLDILIQAAGVEPRDTLLEMDEWDWRRALDINLTGPFLLMQSAGRIMREQGGGVIVNLVSLDQKSGAATSGKKGLLALTQAAASEFEAYNIRVKAVSRAVPEVEESGGHFEDPVELIMKYLGQTEG
ncbi:SDR family NAD(P)-dependent oxidoreductase [Chloroflexota bacterium]